MLWFIPRFMFCLELEILLIIENVFVFVTLYSWKIFYFHSNFHHVSMQVALVSTFYDVSNHGSRDGGTEL